MADRFQHDDGLKAQDIDLRGGRLQRARRMAEEHEPKKLREIEKGPRTPAVERDVEYMQTRVTEGMKKAGRQRKERGQFGVSGYAKPKGKTQAELDEVFKY